MRYFIVLESPSLKSCIGNNNGGGEGGCKHITHMETESPYEFSISCDFCKNHFLNFRFGTPRNCFVRYACNTELNSCIDQGLKRGLGGKIFPKFFYTSLPPARLFLLILQCCVVCFAMHTNFSSFQDGGCYKFGSQGVSLLIL